MASVFSTDGGDEGIRTLDPLLAGQVLSQLSYTPIFEVRSKSEKVEVNLFTLCILHFHNRIPQGMCNAKACFGSGSLKIEQQL